MAARLLRSAGLVLILGLPLRADAADEKSAPANPGIVSRSDAGTLIGAGYAAISEDGRYVAFIANEDGGLYVRDRIDASSERIDLPLQGGLPNGAASQPVVDDDGQVVFATYADNLGYGTVPPGGRQVLLGRISPYRGYVDWISAGNDGGLIAGAVDCFEPDADDFSDRVVFTCSAGDGTRSVYLRDRTNQTTTLVSVDRFGGVPVGSHSEHPAISDDGRYVAFVSDAATLVENDSNGLVDAFVRDLQTATTLRVSLRADGGEIASGSEGVQRVDVNSSCEVAFDHDGNGIVAHDGNNQRDVYYTTCSTGDVRLLSGVGQALDGVPGSGDSRLGSISRNGLSAFVSFDSSVDLLGADSTGGSDAYVRQISSHGLAKVNADTLDGEIFDSFALSPRLSGDSEHVVFIAAGGAVSDQAVARRNGFLDYLYGLDGRAAEVAAFGFADSFAPAVAADGQTLAFMSDSSGFDRGWFGADNDSARDIFVFDARATCVEQASMSDLAFNGGNCPGSKQRKPQSVRKGGGCAAPEICAPAIEPSIDASGQNVVFVVPDSAVAKFANETQKQRGARLKASTYAVTLRNMLTGRTYRVGTGTSAGSGSTPRLAPDGRSLTWVSDMPLDPVDDGNGEADVYRLALKPDGSPDGDLQCLSCKDEAGAPMPPGGSTAPVLSADGETAVFTAPNSAGGRDLMLRDLLTGNSRRIATGTAAPGERQVGQPSMDYSGNRIAFRSDAPLDPTDSNGVADIYLFDVARGELSRVSGDEGAFGAANAASQDPVLSGDGETLAFSTEATNIGEDDYPDANGVADIVVRPLPLAAPRNGIARKLLRTRGGGTSNDVSRRPVFDYSGRRLAYDSAADNLLDAVTDTNGALDVFRHDLASERDRLFRHGFE